MTRRSLLLLLLFALCLPSTAGAETVMALDAPSPRLAEAPSSPITDAHALDATSPPSILVTPAPLTPMPVARWMGIAQTSIAIRETMHREARSLGNYKEGDRVLIVGYEPEWLEVVLGSDESWVTGYVLRHTVWDVEPIDADDLPYGATPAVYSATIGRATPLYAAPEEGAELLWTLTEGTRVAILSIEDGWAKAIFWRQYGYFYLDSASDLEPVYAAEDAQPGDLLAAFVSFFSLSEEGLNPNRIINIAKACEYISIEMEPGFAFTFNGIAGPYQPGRGYLYGMSYFEGEAVPSYGGGTCQVSSTLYNVLLPLHRGITVTYRRAHGPSGAKYLPHGVDAAVGNTTLDLMFRNDYDFPVRIEAGQQDGVLYIAMRRG